MNIYDIANRAGVSIATVSRVINGSPVVSQKTRDRVNEVMIELKYTPNVFVRGLMVNSMKIIGIMTIDVRDLYYANAIHTIELEMRDKGYDVILCSTSGDINEKKKYLNLLIEKRVDGIILIGSVFKEKSDNRHIIEAAQNVPVVMVNGNVEGENIYSIVCDDAYAIYTTTKYLFDKGHSNIVYIYDVDTFSGYEKLKGFKKIMMDRGIDTRGERIIKTEKGIVGGYKALEKIIEAGTSFSAVVTAEDELAVGAMKKLRELGKRIPEDVAVVGFNNSMLAECTTPELTSVDNKVEEISSKAAKMLMDAMEGKNIPVKTVITPLLIERQTT